MIRSVSKTFTGNGTNYIGQKLRGRILAIKVEADDNVTDNFDIALTGRTTGVPILTDATVTKNTTTWWHPRAIPAKHSDGSAFTDFGVEIPVAGEQVQCVTANAGTTGEITVTVVYDDDN